MRARRVIALLLVSTVFLLACEDLPDDPGGTSTSTSPDTTAPPTTGTDVGGGSPVLMTLAIHVEGWTGEDVTEAKFDRHVDNLMEIATAAQDYGAVVTFELTPDFTAAVVNWDSDILDVLTAMGHGIAIHADAGGRGEPTLEEFTADLESQLAGLEATGYTTTHVSGICSRGPWVESAVAAGFISVAGGVEYCLTSLDPEYMPEGSEWIYDCATPAACHGAVPLDTRQVMYPWWASASADWVVPSDEGDLLIITGGAEARMSCFVYEGTGACPDQEADLDTLTAAIDLYVGLHGDSSDTAVLPLTWSVGRQPADGWAEALFATVEPYQDAGLIEWTSLPAAAERMGA